MIQETSRQPRISPLAGQPAPKEMLIDISRVEREYHARKPDMDDHEPARPSAPAGPGIVSDYRSAERRGAPSRAQSIYKRLRGKLQGQAHLDAMQ